MRRLALLLLFAALAAGVVYFGFDPAAPARSGGEKWGPSHGPEGGPAFALAVAPSAPEIMYVGTGRGVFKSMNGGRWASAGLAEPPGRDGPTDVTSLAVDPRSPTTVYAGLRGRWDGEATYRRPVFKTTNGGHTWRALGLRGQVVAISPTAPPTVYAAAGGSGGTDRLFRSTDGGRSWQPADRGLPSTYTWALAFDPTSPATVYAATGRRGVFVSGDSGGSWRTLGASAAYREASAVGVDPRTPHTVYAGTDAGVIKSLDGGGSWRLVNAKLGGHGRDRGYMQVSALVVDPHDSRTVYATARCAGVFKSADGGRRWSPVFPGLDPRCTAVSLALDPRASQTIYAAGAPRGVFKSIDGGARWHAMNTGLSLAAVFSLAVDPRRPRTVYAAAGALGLFTSSDGGAHWRSLPSGPKLVNEVALDPSNPRNILAVAAGYGVVRSTDAGRTWVGASLGAGARLVQVVAISGKSAYAGVPGRGLFGSSDGGRSWRELGALGALGVRRVDALAIAPADAAVVYAGVTGFGLSNAAGLYRSTDGGNSWMRLTDALDTGVEAIALDPKNPETVYIGTGGKAGVFKSTDGGTSWEPADSGLPRLRVKTATGKWITEGFDVTDLAIDPAHPTMLYAVPYGHGVFGSTNSGKSWHSLNAGLTMLDVRALAVDATGQTLYAGTGGGGVVSLHMKT